MIKEILAGALLVALLVLSMINVGAVERLSDRMTNHINSALGYARLEQWDEAAKSAEAAAKLWREKDSYTHIFLRHSEIDSATDALYELLKAIYAQEYGTTKGAAYLARSHFESIKSMEQIRFGSIFTRAALTYRPADSSARP